MIERRREEKQRASYLDTPIDKVLCGMIHFACCRGDSHLSGELASDSLRYRNDHDRSLWSTSAH